MALGWRQGLWRRSLRILAWLLLAGCDAQVLPLPQADDPVFLRMADVQLGMRQSELLRRHPSLETSPEGELREAYGAGWITYGFRGLTDLRLSSVRVWMAFSDSASLRERHDDLVASLRSAYGDGGDCYRRTSSNLNEMRFVWEGEPSTGVSSQIFASGDRRGYTAELVVLVGDSVPRLYNERIPCGDHLFSAEAPIRVDEALVRALTNRVKESDAEKFGRLPRRIPLSELRHGTSPKSAGVTEGFARTVVSGERLAASVTPIPGEVLDIPYWTGIFRRIGAEADGRVYAATNLFYRIYTFVGEGEPVDSIVAAPPSWREPRRPREGEFPPERTAEWSSYLDSLTVVDGLAALCDSVLVVSTGSFHEVSTSTSAKAPHLLQIYVNGQPRAVDLPSPGDLVAYSSGSLFFLAPDSQPGSRLVEYVWRDATTPGNDPGQGCAS